eukprot:scaffold24246_cov106-Isochrysis_galbana.AAC.2
MRTLPSRASVLDPPPDESASASTDASAGSAIRQTRGQRGLGHRGVGLSQLLLLDLIVGRLQHNHKLRRGGRGFLGRLVIVGGRLLLVARRRTLEEQLRLLQVLRESLQHVALVQASGRGELAAQNLCRQRVGHDRAGRLDLGGKIVAAGGRLGHGGGRVNVRQLVLGGDGLRERVHRNVVVAVHHQPQRVDLPGVPVLLHHCRQVVDGRRLQPDARLEELIVLGDEDVRLNGPRHLADAQLGRQFGGDGQERLRHLLLLAGVHCEQVRLAVLLQKPFDHRAQVGDVDGGEQVGAVVEREERQRVAVPRRLEERVEDVLLCAICDSGGHHVCAQNVVPLALGDQLLKGEQVLELDLRPASLVLVLRQRRLRRLLVDRRAHPRDDRRDADEHLGLGDLVARRDGGQLLLSQHRLVEAVQHGHLALKEGRLQGLGSLLHNPAHPERLGLRV